MARVPSLAGMTLSSCLFVSLYDMHLCIPIPREKKMGENKKGTLDSGYIDTMDSVPILA